MLLIDVSLARLRSYACPHRYIRSIKLKPEKDVRDC